MILNCSCFIFFQVCGKLHVIQLKFIEFSHIKWIVLDKVYFILIRLIFSEINFISVSGSFTTVCNHLLKHFCLRQFHYRMQSSTQTFLNAKTNCNSSIENILMNFSMCLHRGGKEPKWLMDQSVYYCDIRRPS